MAMLLVHLGSMHCTDGGLPLLMILSCGRPHTGHVVSTVCMRAPLGSGYARLQSGYPSHPMKLPFLDLLTDMLLPQVGQIPMCCCECRASFISLPISADSSDILTATSWSISCDSVTTESRVLLPSEMDSMSDSSLAVISGSVMPPPCFSSDFVSAIPLGVGIM